jgi:hypothetical protein
MRASCACWRAAPGERAEEEVDVPALVEDVGVDR